MEAIEAEDGSHASHGFKVGIGSIAVAGLYEQLFACDLEHLDASTLIKTWPVKEDLEGILDKVFSKPQMVDSALKESQAKYLSPNKLSRRLDLLREKWPGLKIQLQKQLVPAGELQKMLNMAGCPTQPEQIGLTRQQLKESYFLARVIRKRYTVLDMAAEAGFLAPCVDKLFAIDGFWQHKAGMY